MNKYFPFSAIVGQEQMKLALILTAIDPSIGGVLVFGDRGTGKSTIVRSLAGLLPKQNFVADCSFNCQDFCEECKKNKSLEFEERATPVIDLPLGSTEDRVVGALNLEIALTEGRKVFEPGLLAKANGGFLYIDEVNLLEDHIVDLLLDVAASGENLVERDGISIRHSSKFVLIGSGNPEEGELRPQLLDRFGFSVNVGSPSEISQRIEVIKRRDEFERDPQNFLRKWRSKDLLVQKKIINAKNTLDSIKYKEYKVNLSKEETDKRIKEIASNQKNFVEVDPAKVANEGDLVTFDYKATVDGKEFKGSEGKNTQLELGKDLFIKGFDKQLEGVKSGDTKNVEVNLPENFPEKELVNKSAVFECKVTAVRIPEEVKINDDFAKNMGAKDLANLKELISKQINDEYKNSLAMITKKSILEQIEKEKLDQLPGNLIEQEVKILSQGMKEDEVKKKQKSLEEQAKKRIKTGLILNAFGEENKINVSQEEINVEIQKQFRMMPGQEKIVKDYYEQNPAAIDSLRGQIYEEKIIEEIKKKAKTTKKEITKEEAEKILKEENENNIKAVSYTQLTLPPNREV